MKYCLGLMMKKKMIFILDKGFIRFKFRTDDNLVYNEKITVNVCVISLTSVVKR